jgi:phage terminase large subunit-like protein
MQTANNLISIQAARARAAQADRVLSRRRLLHFTKRFRPRYLDGWVHRVIAHKLEKFSEDVQAQRSPRLLLLVPPRHGKSLLASEMFPAWDLGKHPHNEIIAASYNVSLPISFSRKVRELVRDPDYEKIFPTTKLHPESQANEAWLTTAGGGYIAAGVGGGITGKGASILIVDDPIKDAKEADSPTIRDDLWDWYGSTAYTRLSPGGGVLWIQTWWNEDDGAGRIQLAMDEDPDFDQFEIIKFPAVAEENEYLDADYNIYRASECEVPSTAHLVRSKGEALHADRYTLPMLQRIEKTLTRRHWSALYQQNPTPEEGLFFTRDMFLPVISLPGNMIRARGIRYTAWDFAITEKTRGDWTVGATIEQDHNDEFEALDCVRGKWSNGDDIVTKMCDSYEKWYPDYLIVEDGAIWKTMSASFKKECKKRELKPSLLIMKTLGQDKGVRAQPLQIMMQQGRMRFPLNAPWFEALQREFLRFLAGGTKDDMVDAFSWAAIVASQKSAPRVPSQARKSSWRDRLRTLAAGGRAVTHMAA